MFSEREEQIIKIIGKKALTLQNIASKLYGGPYIPMDAVITVGNSVRRIIKKCEHNKLKWTLVKHNTGVRGIITIQRGNL